MCLTGVTLLNGGDKLNSDIIDRAKSGDGDAFAELFSEVQDELYKVAYIYVKNREDARDVVQETAYRCFKGIKTLRHNEYFRTWAVKTAINCSLNILRREHRTVPLDELPELEASVMSPESAALASVTLERLMNSLDEREKSILLLTHLYGFSHSEIAKELHMPLGTVKTILYRAINKIKREDSE